MKNAISIPNDILSEALLRYQNERIDNKYPLTGEYNEQMEPNKQTEEKINRLIQLEKKPYFILINTIGKRVACIIIAMILAMTTTVLSVEAFREPFINYIIETYEEWSTISFNNSESQNSEGIVLNEIYEPSYIPEGFTKTFEEELSLSYFCEYSNANNEIIVYQQNLLNNIQVNIDTEATVTEKIYINNVEAIFYENKGQNHILLKGDQYVFFIAGNIEKSELIKVAESIEKIK
ncbi:MAG: DUF4367 domain-containing protein [Clostridia bacterium]